MSRFSEEDESAVKRLLQLSTQKDFIADLLLNGYDGHTYKVNMREVMRYATGIMPQYREYRDDVLRFLSLMEKGVETYEIIGNVAIKTLFPISQETE